MSKNSSFLKWDSIKRAQDEMEAAQKAWQKAKDNHAPEEMEAAGRAHILAKNDYLRLIDEYNQKNPHTLKQPNPAVMWLPFDKLGPITVVKHPIKTPTSREIPLPTSSDVLFDITSIPEKMPNGDTRHLLPDEAVKLATQEAFECCLSQADKALKADAPLTEFTKSIRKLVSIQLLAANGFPAGAPIALPMRAEINNLLLPHVENLIKANLLALFNAPARNVHTVKDLATGEIYLADTSTPEQKNRRTAALATFGLPEATGQAGGVTLANLQEILMREGPDSQRLQNLYNVFDIPQDQQKELTQLFRSRHKIYQSKITTDAEIEVIRDNRQNGNGTAAAFRKAHAEWIDCLDWNERVQRTPKEARDVIAPMVAASAATAEIYTAPSGPLDEKSIGDHVQQAVTATSGASAKAGAAEAANKSTQAAITATKERLERKGEDKDTPADIAVNIATNALNHAQLLNDTPDDFINTKQESEEEKEKKKEEKLTFGKEAYSSQHIAHLKSSSKPDDKALFQFTVVKAATLASTLDITLRAKGVNPSASKKVSHAVMDSYLEHKGDNSHLTEDTIKQCILQTLDPALAVASGVTYSITSGVFYSVTSTSFSTEIAKKAGEAAGKAYKETKGTKTKKKEAAAAAAHTILFGSDGQDEKSTLKVIMCESIVAAAAARVPQSEIPNAANAAQVEYREAHRKAHQTATLVTDIEQKTAVKTATEAAKAASNKALSELDDKYQDEAQKDHASAMVVSTWTVIFVTLGIPLKEAKQAGEAAGKAYKEAKGTETQKMEAAGKAANETLSGSGFSNLSEIKEEKQENPATVLANRVIAAAQATGIPKTVAEKAGEAAKKAYERDAISEKQKKANAGSAAMNVLSEFGDTDKDEEYRDQALAVAGEALAAIKTGLALTEGVKAQQSVTLGSRESTKQAAISAGFSPLLAEEIADNIHETKDFTKENIADHVRTATTQADNINGYIKRLYALKPSDIMTSKGVALQHFPPHFESARDAIAKNCIETGKLDQHKIQQILTQFLGAQFALYAKNLYDWMRFQVEDEKIKIPVGKPHIQVADDAADKIFKVAESVYSQEHIAGQRIEKGVTAAAEAAGVSPEEAKKAGEAARKAYSTTQGTEAQKNTAARDAAIKALPRSESGDSTAALAIAAVTRGDENAVRSAYSQAQPRLQTATAAAIRAGAATAAINADLPPELAAIIGERAATYFLENGHINNERLTAIIGTVMQEANCRQRMIFSHAAARHAHLGLPNNKKYDELAQSIQNQLQDYHKTHGDLSDDAIRRIIIQQIDNYNTTQQPRRPLKHPTEQDFKKITGDFKHASFISRAETISLCIGRIVLDEKENPDDLIQNLQQQLIKHYADHGNLPGNTIKTIIREQIAAYNHLGHNIPIPGEEQFENIIADLEEAVPGVTMDTDPAFVLSDIDRENISAHTVEAYAIAVSTAAIKAIVKKYPDPKSQPSNLREIAGAVAGLAAAYELSLPLALKLSQRMTDYYVQHGNYDKFNPTTLNLLTKKQARAILEAADEISGGSSKRAEVVEKLAATYGLSPSIARTLSTRMEDYYAKNGLSYDGLDLTALCQLTTKQVDALQKAAQAAATIPPTSDAVAAGTAVAAQAFPEFDQPSKAGVVAACVASARNSAKIESAQTNPSNYAKACRENEIDMGNAATYAKGVSTQALTRSAHAATSAAAAVRASVTALTIDEKQYKIAPIHQFAFQQIVSEIGNAVYTTLASLEAPDITLAEQTKDVIKTVVTDALSRSEKIKNEYKLDGAGLQDIKTALPDRATLAQLSSVATEVYVAAIKLGLQPNQAKEIVHAVTVKNIIDGGAAVIKGVIEAKGIEMQIDESFNAANRAHKLDRTVIEQRHVSNAKIARAITELKDPADMNSALATARAVYNNVKRSFGSNRSPVVEAIAQQAVAKTYLKILEYRGSQLTQKESETLVNLSKQAWQKSIYSLSEAGLLSAPGTIISPWMAKNLTQATKAGDLISKGIVAAKMKEEQEAQEEKKPTDDEKKAHAGKRHLTDAQKAKTAVEAIATASGISGQAIGEKVEKNINDGTDAARVGASAAEVKAQPETQQALAAVAAHYAASEKGEQHQDKASATAVAATFIGEDRALPNSPKDIEKQAALQERSEEEMRRKQQAAAGTFATLQAEERVSDDKLGIAETMRDYSLDISFKADVDKAGEWTVRITTADGGVKDVKLEDDETFKPLIEELKQCKDFINIDTLMMAIDQFNKKEKASRTYLGYTLGSEKPLLPFNSNTVQVGRDGTLTIKVRDLSKDQVAGLLKIWIDVSKSAKNTQQLTNPVFSGG